MFQEAKRRIFILRSSSLLAAGIEVVFREMGWEKGTFPLVAEDVLQKEGFFTPSDIVIFDTNDSAVHPSISLLRILVPSPDIQIIGLDPVENRMEIYRKQQRPMVRLQDFLKVVESSLKSERRHRTS